MTKQDLCQLLTPEYVANYLGVSLGTLSVWRCTGRVNLPYVKLGRKVMYRQKAVDAFLDRQTCDNEAA